MCSSDWEEPSPNPKEEDKQQYSNIIIKKSAAHVGCQGEQKRGGTT